MIKFLYFKTFQDLQLKEERLAAMHAGQDGNEPVLREKISISEYEVQSEEKLVDEHAEATEEVHADKEERTEEKTE